MHAQRVRYVIPAALAVVLALTFAVYRPGLHGPFLFDDNLAIVANDHLAVTTLSPAALIEAALSGQAGVLGRPVGMLSFAVNRYVGGLDPWGYKAVNVIIHAANGAGVYLLSVLILAALARRDATAPPLAHRRAIALTAAAAWLLHPLNVSSVLYVVQRMNELAALFTLGGLVLYLHGRLRLNDGRGGAVSIVAAAAVCWPLAAFSKENGALLPLYTLVLEAVLFGFAAPGRGRRWLITLFAVTVGVPAAAAGISLLVDPDWAMQGYRARDFTPVQRLLTEARVLWRYVEWIIWPRPGALGLFHDDIPVSRGLLTPPTTLVAVAGHAAALAAAVMVRRRLPLLTLAILFFYAGHALESTIFPLAPAFEHRNYLPMAPLLLAGVYGVYRLGAATGRGRRAICGAAAVVLGVLALLTAQRAVEWSSLGHFAAAQVQHHPRSPRANYLVGWLYYVRTMREPTGRERDFANARRYFSRATLLDAHYTGGLFGLLIAYESTGRRLDSRLFTMLQARLAAPPFTSNEANWLRQTVMCVMAGPCRTPPARVLALLDAAVDNTSLYGADKAYVLSIKSRYVADAQRDVSEGVRLAEQAAGVTPANLDLRLDVVDLLIRSGRLGEARRRLDEIRHLDTLGAYTSGIAQQAQRLARAAAGPGAAPEGPRDNPDVKGE